MVSEQHDKLQQSVKKQVNRYQQAEQQKNTVLIYTSYIGVLGLVLVLPIVGGAYLGRWLDSFNSGFTISWTISFIILGIIIGAMNVYFLIETRL